jgi:flagellar biosynthesis protein FlhB
MKKQELPSSSFNTLKTSQMTDMDKINEIEERFNQQLNLKKLLNFRKFISKISITLTVAWVLAISFNLKDMGDMGNALSKSLSFFFAMSTSALVATYIIEVSMDNKGV